MRRTELLKMKPGDLKRVCASYGVSYAAGSKDTRDTKLVRRTACRKRRRPSPPLPFSL
jgi:hypothetical protein